MMIRLPCILFSLAFLINQFVLFNSAPAQTEARFMLAWQGVQDYFTTALREMEIVGGSMMFLHAGEVEGAVYYGMADKDVQRPVDKHTIYHWASITKTFTGIAIMQLRDRQLLSLDHAIIDYIPELKAVHNPYGDMRNITIRQLMSHSAGFRDPTWPWGGDQDWHPYEPKEWQQLVAMMPYTEILFKPGSQYRYSNLGIVFLGRIIELISGDDFEVYIDKNIFKPLEMYKSYFDHTPYHLLAFRSNNYYIINGEMITNGLDFDTGVTVSNGGLNAPLGDMMKYLNFLIGNGDSYNGILNRSSLEEMWHIQHEVSSDSKLKESIALNFFIIERGDLQVIGHTGEQKGFMSFFYIHPKSRIGCLVVFNTVVNTFNTEGDLVELNTINLRRNLRLKILDENFPIYTN